MADTSTEVLTKMDVDDIKLSKTDDQHTIENEISLKELKDTDSKSWFLVIANPHELFKDEDDKSWEPQKITEYVCNKWCANNENRACICAYCVSKNGFIHLHVCCCDKNKSRFSAVKKLFPTANIRASKGTKAQIEDYIYKRGKWEEKDEAIICVSRHGEIVGRQGQRSDLNNIRELIKEGYTPEQIFRSNINYRKYEKMVRDEYFDNKLQSTPLERDVKVIWHVGLSGTGKSHTMIDLVKQYGRNDVYVVNSYDSGMFDKYCGQSILFLDEFKGEINFQTLLVLLDNYTNQVHCRYSNSFMLWNEVHISSVYPPEEIYRLMCPNTGYRYLDTYEQLKRRINEVVYHYKDGDRFMSFSLSMSEYSSYDNLKNSIGRADLDFKNVDVTDECPFAKAVS